MCRSVLHAVGGRLELLKLRNVRAGDERLSSRAAENEHVHAVVAIDAFAGVDERVVHAPRHRVARLRAIEGQESERRFDLEKRFCGCHA